MQKEIKIINYIFKIDKKICFINVEKYENYNGVESKLKFLYNDEYIEEYIYNYQITDTCILFDDFKIYKDYIELNTSNHQIRLNINNELLISDFLKQSSKNSYILYEENYMTGIIDKEEVKGMIFSDYEVIKTIPDNYLKFYVIDFEEFKGMFSVLCNDNKVISINLKYKDVEFKNKRVLYLNNVKIFKRASIKLKISGHFYWTIKFKENKNIKANPSIIPFKYSNGNLLLFMKKKLFKQNLKATCKNAFVISFQYL